MPSLVPPCWHAFASDDGGTERGPDPTLQHLDEPLAAQAVRDVDAAFPLRHRGAIARANDARHLVLRQAVASTEGPQPAPQLQPVAAEAVHLGACVALSPPVLGQRHGDDQFPARVIGHSGLCECMGTSYSPSPYSRQPGT